MEHVRFKRHDDAIQVLFKLQIDAEKKRDLMYNQKCPRPE